MRYQTQEGIAINKMNNMKKVISRLPMELINFNRVEGNNFHNGLFTRVIDVFGNTKTTLY